ncbi:phage protein [Sphingomonas sanguinis]|uniref:Phage protein n=2 Tax=Sphingomonas sanguinis TaxID=33051 RepID=A0A147HSX0_9SPHN|nr:phage protein [Sphingomonas sanguinis]
MIADMLTGWVLCWRIERRDGVTIGLTGHDHDLWLDGLRYRAAPGLTPSAILRGDGLDPDLMEASGALTSAAIGERDLLSGRWDGATVAAIAVDWSGENAPVPLGQGAIGAVQLGEGGFTAELGGVAALLDRPVAEETSPDCRASLGDRRCRVAMAGRRRFMRVVAWDGEAMLTLDTTEPVANAYGQGRLIWFGGANAGLEAMVARPEGSRLWLSAAPAFAVEGRPLVELVEGCDKRLETCLSRFANTVNFRGEPFLPGIDLLTRYPGA